MRYTEEDYINVCNELGMEYIGNYKEKNHGTIIKFICPTHRQKGVQVKDWAHFRVSKKGCPYCSGRYKTNDDIYALIKNKDVELISEYIGSEKPIRCKCKKCNTEWETKPKVLTTNGSGCPKCGKEKAQLSRRKTKEEFVKELYKVNKYITVIGEYKSTHNKIRCKCKIDGYEWDGYPANLLNNSAGCPLCNMSNGERKLLSTLSNLGINYVHQYSFDDCKSKYKLRFDAFDIDNNIAYEYNGEQHYFPVDFANKGYEWANKEFEITKLRDSIKTEYCNKKKIPLVIIPYFEKDNMESFIVEKLKEIKEIKQLNN